MKQPENQEFLETAIEQVKDAINILQLLSVDLSANEEDSHILRSVSIVERILKSAESDLSQLQETKTSS